MGDFVGDNKDSAWLRIATFALWLVFFFMGAIPEEVYLTLREWGGVVTMSALVNSAHVLTLGLSGYLGWFTYARAAEAGCDDVIARGKGLQMFCIGLIAFSCVPLEYLARLGEIKVAFYRHLVLATAAVKMGMWSYALSLIIRYYFLSGPRVFANMASLFPSTRGFVRDDTDAA